MSKHTPGPCRGMTELLRVTTVDDCVYWIARADHEQCRVHIPLRCQSGRRWSDLTLGLRPGGLNGPTMIHRDNIVKAESWPNMNGE